MRNIFLIHFRKLFTVMSQVQLVDDREAHVKGRFYSLTENDLEAGLS